MNNIRFLFGGVIKEVGRWGQKLAIFDDLQYCKSSKRWVGGPKKVKKRDDVILEWSLKHILLRKKLIKSDCY